MKKFAVISAVLILSAFSIDAQQRYCSKVKCASVIQHPDLHARQASPTSQASHELSYDVKFVHLNLNLERNTKYVSGNVKTVATVVATSIDTFMTLLHEDLIIDSLRFNGALLSAVRVDSMVKVKIPAPLSSGQSFTVIVYYKGIPPTGGSAIGSGFNTGVSGQWNSQCTWSLSEAIVAYHWWPCKQVLTDKIDSSWVYVTTDSANKVGSNGRLKNVVTIGNKKRYEWQSRSPIDYYLISVAVAKYKEYNIYAKPQYLLNDSILIQNYIYDNAINASNFIAQQKADLDRLPAVMKLFCNVFGMYPFYKEKYGHCMAPFSGGMEHQTMTSLGFFDYYIDAHELGHQWWGDNVTCKSWGDIWINEGFATYSEYLTSFYLDYPAFIGKISGDHSYIMSLPGGSLFFTDTMNSNVIFDSRLSYAKGGSIIRTLQFVTNNDSVWFKTLRGFQNTYKNSTASVIDFKNYYETQTGINTTQFFDQWFYGEGYPTFTVKYNHINNNLIFSSVQTVSTPSTTPLFITPMQYRIKRIGLADTIVNVMHANPTEIYTFPMSGTVTGIFCDPNNWVINKAPGAVMDPSLTNGIISLPGMSDVITIGPNPSRGVFYVYNPANLSGRILVRDLTGSLILEKNLEGTTMVDLLRFTHGLYEVSVIDDNGKEIYTRKMLSE